MANVAVKAKSKTPAKVISKSPSAVSAKKKIKRKVPRGHVYVNASFNNTIITVTDEGGNVLYSTSAGACGFRGSRKCTPFAAQSAAEKAANLVRENYSMENVKVYVCGPGPGREAAVRPFGNAMKVIMIMDITGVPHNGCRPPKEPRK